MRWRRPHDLVPALGAEDRAAPERVHQQRRTRSEVRNDEVAGKPDTRDRDVRTAGDLDVDHRQQDRQAAAPGEDHVEHRVVRIVVVLSITAEAVSFPQQPAARTCDPLWSAAGLGRRLDQLRSERVERRHCTGHVDVAKLPRRPRARGGPSEVLARPRAQQMTASPPSDREARRRIYPRRPSSAK